MHSQRSRPSRKYKQVGYNAVMSERGVSFVEIKYNNDYRFDLGSGRSFTTRDGVVGQRTRISLEEKSSIIVNVEAGGMG